MLTSFPLGSHRSRRDRVKAGVSLAPHAAQKRGDCALTVQWRPSSCPPRSGLVQRPLPYPVLPRTDRNLRAIVRQVYCGGLHTPQGVRPMAFAALTLIF